MREHRSIASPGRRAVLRWSWRMFRREWRHQLLILTLVTVAVTAAVAGASMVVNGVSERRGEFGDAGALVRLSATDPAKVQADLAAVRARFGDVEVIGHQSVPVPGSAEALDLRSQAPDGLFSRPMLALRAGRYPTASDEVALTRGAAERLGVELGDAVDLGGVMRTVVGEVENPGDLQDDFGVLPATNLVGADSYVVLIDSFDGGGGAGSAETGGQGFGVEGAPDDDAAIAAVVLIVTTLAMALVALIAAAGFVVMAQRRQRQLGLLAALGATERHLRLAVLANGMIVGMVAAVAGGALGILVWVAAAPAVEAAAGHRIDRLALPWGLIVECLLLAVVASAAAAWWPARTMARLPVMEALSRRPARPSPVHRSLLVAVGLVGAGVAGITSSNPVGDHVRPLVLIVAVLALVIGTVLAAPAAVRLLAAPAARLPFTIRLALRDLARHQARTAAALAAITLGLGISVSVLVLAGVNAPRPDEGNLPNNQLLISVGDLRSVPNPDLTAADEARLDEAAATIAATLGSPTVLPLDVVLPTDRGNDNVRETVAVAVRVGPQTYRNNGFPYVATPTVLDQLGIDAADIEPSTELLTSSTGDAVLIDLNGRPGDVGRATPLQRVGLPTYSSSPSSLVTETAMRAHRWLPARAAWLVQAEHPLTADQLAAARRVAGDVGLVVEARTSQDGLAALRTAATTAGVLLALAIVAVTVGLLRGESVRDLRTLTAIGATPNARRSLTAATAGALALLGVVLALGGGYAAIAAAYHADLRRLAPVPYGHLVLLVVGLPAVALAGGWTLGGREPHSFARQSLD